MNLSGFFKTGSEVETNRETNKLSAISPSILHFLRRNFCGGFLFILFISAEFSLSLSHKTLNDGK